MATYLSSDSSPASRYLFSNFYIQSQKGESNNIIISLWTYIYWLSFLATWFVLPFYQEYFYSREKTISLKIKDSLKRNLIFYLLLGAIFLIVLIIMMFQGKLKEISVFQLVGGLANCL